MEKTVTLRFYDVSRTSTDKPAMVDLLERIAALPLPERERRITGEDILVRLENYASRAGEISGQFVRGQSGNLPGRMMPDGISELPFSEPLGHGIAFRYRVSDGLLAIQYDPRVLSPSRVLEYLYEHDGMAEYRLEPRMRGDAWQMFNDLPVRKLEVAIAGQPNLTDLSDEGRAVWHEIAQLKEAYGADTIRIQLTMGHRKGALTEGIRAFAREALRRNESSSADIRSLKATVQTGDGVPNEEFDLMGQLFDVKADLNFPERNVQRFYDLRRELLRTNMRQL